MAAQYTTATGTPWLSLVIPLYNEAESLRPLYDAIKDALGAGDNYEILFVDDGSTDASLSLLNSFQNGDGSVRVLHFARNFGKAEALAAGFRESRGEVIITMDADLQDDPQEIPHLVSTLAKGYDLVSGWKQHRRDPVTKTMPSRVFNAVTSYLTGIKLKDFNSGFKAYRRRLVDELHIYGELHRFLPALAYWKGFRVTEVPVVHHARRFGSSKYGARRFLSGFLDLLTVLFLTRFRRKPLHLFGTLGLACLGIGVVINLYLTTIWLQGEAIGTRPLLQLGVLLMVMGIQFLSMGLLGEMLTVSSVEERGRTHVYEVMEPPVAPTNSQDEAATAASSIQAAPQAGQPSRQAGSR